MHDLRFIGVDEPGTHLLLGDDDGNRFRVPADAGLRAAVRRETPSSPTAPAHQRPVPVVGEGGLRPKDVQAMIRAGHSAEVVAERAGWSVEKVHRYEGPILGERAYVAGLARQVRLRPRGGVHATAATLEARVAERMQAREIEPATATWDSLRTPTGRWSVVVFFSAGGRERQARWEFDQLARTVSASDDEARWLSEDEDEPAPGPLAAPHLQAPTRPSRVYDVEAEGGIEAPQRRRRSEPVDLMSTMRERSAQRGRRRRSKASEAPGLDRVPDEALPLENLAMSPDDAGEPPAAHPRTEPSAGESPVDQASDDSDVQTVDDSDEVAAVAPDAKPSKTGGLVDEPLPLDIGLHDEPVNDGNEGGTKSAEGPDNPDDADDADDVHTLDAEGVADSDDVSGPDDADLAGTDGAESVADDVQVPADADTAEAGAADTADAGTPPASAETVAGVKTKDEAVQPNPPAKRTAARKSGRPSVPSWDDIMFGKKSD